MYKNSLHPLIESRYSPRAYSSKQLSSDVIVSLFEAARWAASSRNSQPWRFIYATPEQISTWQKLYDCLVPFNQEWVKSAPFLMLALVQKIDTERNIERKNVAYDLGLAMGNFTMQALHLGIYLRNIGGLSVQKAIEHFMIPEEFEPVIMVTAGYLGDEEELPEHLLVPKADKRTRKSFDSIIFDGEWDKMK